MPTHSRWRARQSSLLFVSQPHCSLAPLALSFLASVPFLPYDSLPHCPSASTLALLLTLTLPLYYSAQAFAFTLISAAPPSLSVSASWSVYVSASAASWFYLILGTEFSVSWFYLILGTEDLSSSHASFELMLILFVCVFVEYMLLCACMCRYNFCYQRLMGHCRNGGRIILTSREMKALL